MSTLTDRLQLKKPDVTDPISPSDFNENFDTLDSVISNLIVLSKTTATWSPIQGGKVYDQYVTLTPIPGYKVIGIVSIMIHGNNGTYVSPNFWDVDSSAGTARFRLRDNGTAVTGTLTVEIGAIYIKTFE